MHPLVVSRETQNRPNESKFRFIAYASDSHDAGWLIANAMLPDSKAYSPHTVRDLRVYDVDAKEFSSYCDEARLDRNAGLHREHVTGDRSVESHRCTTIKDFGRNNSRLEVFASRDSIFSFPLQDGEWDDDSLEATELIPEALVAPFPALTTRKIYLELFIIGKHKYRDYRTRDDIYTFLASRLHGFEKRACEAANRNCKLQMIVLVVQIIVIPDSEVRKHRTPEERVVVF
jgi:hypothetical protein